ncbi:MAG TPA: NAD-dependent epimerase/dehydratase family protein, partial [Bacteroidota bacterium]|nr:NAD-dependent epimerase/dehydratase family protein [Bacteroidota bacterium]
MTVLVTGASGCVGSNIIAELLHRGHQVIAFHRGHSNLTALEGLSVDHRIGDTRDKESVKKAIEGCNAVIHTAAIVAFWKLRRQEQLDVNVGGTRNVVEACCEAGIRKLVHTSSVAAIGFRTDGQPSDELTEYNWGSDNGYRYSKHLSELEVLKGVERGLAAC